MTATENPHDNATTRPAVMVWPGLKYRDAHAAIRFLVDAFGFDAVAVYTGADEDVLHAELRWPEGGGVMLGSARPTGALCDLPAGTGLVYVVTTEPDALFERATAAGATVVQEPRHEHYGSRGFTVRDPEGVLWSFGTYAGT